MRNLLSILLASLLAFNAVAVNVTAYPHDVTAGSPAFRNVTVTLVNPSGPVVSGPWIFSGDSVTLNTGTNGSVTFSNMLALGEYTMSIQGNPGRSFPFSISNITVTNNSLNVEQLNATNISAQVFYDSSQVDALLQQAKFGSSNYVNQAVTNAIIGQLGASNNYNGTFSGPVAGAASSATNAVFAGTATNAITATNSLFSSTATNAITATNSLFASTATNAITSTNSLFAGTATNAITATNALFASTATNAITATNALFAGTATNAITSTNSLFASTATNAITATNSLFSSTATNAITATNSLFSGTATNAITATNGPALGTFLSYNHTNASNLSTSNLLVTATITEKDIVGSGSATLNLFPSTNLLVSGIAPTNGSAGKFVGWTAGGAVWTNPPTSTSTTGTNIFYVSPTGLSVNSGLSTLTPWPLQYALNQIQPGWTLLLMDGYYDASTNNPGPNSTFVFAQTAGTPANYMTIKAINKWQAVIGGGTNGGIAASPTPGFQTAGVIFDGLKVANNPGDGLGAWQYSIIRNCWIATNGLQGINISSSLAGSNIVEKCVLEWNGTNSGSAGHYHNIYMAGPGNIFRGNVVRYAQTGYGLQIYTSNSGQSNNWDQVYDNLFYGNTNFGYGVISFNYQDTGAGVMPGTNYFYNNTMLDGIRVRGGGSVIQNNIILANSLNTTTPINTLGTPNVVVYSDYNLWTNSNGQVSAMITPGAHEVFTNTTAAALFVNPSKGLMWLPSTSPARGVGTNYPTGLDWLGNAQATVTDVGAYQYFPNWPAADTRTLDPSSYPDYWIVQASFIPQAVPTSTLYATLATNLVVAPNLTNPAVWVTAGGSIRANYINGNIALQLDQFGNWTFNDTNGTALISYSRLADSLTLGTDAGSRLLINGAGTALFDQGNSPRLNVNTNRVDINTNVNVYALNASNSLSASSVFASSGITNAGWTQSGSLLVTNGGTVTIDGGNVVMAASGLFVSGSGGLIANTPPLNLGSGATIASGNGVLAANDTFIGSSGTQAGLAVTPHIAQSGTASSSALLVNDSMNGIGSGEQDLVTLQTNGIVKWNVDISGNQTNSGSIKALSFIGNVTGNLTGTATSVASVPDGSLSANVSLNNAANGFTGLNTFGQLSKMDSLTVTNGLTNQFLTANALAYSDANKRLQSISAGGASQYLKAGTPPAFATIQASDISGSIPFSGVASAANGLTSGSPGTNNVFWTDQYNSNALYTTGKWIVISNAAGKVLFSGGNQTNDGVVQAAQFLGPNGQLTVGGNQTLSSGNAITIAGATLSANSGTQAGVLVNPGVLQSGSAGFVALQVNPVISGGTGSGVQDALELMKSGTVNMNVDVNGNQTNAGNVKASAFYGTLHGNADTASSVASANSAGVSSTLVAAAVVTNLQSWIIGAAGGQSSVQFFYPNGANAFQQNTNGQFVAYDTTGTAWLNYSGNPTASDSLVLSLHAGNVLVGDASAGTTIYDAKGNPIQTLTKSAVTIKTNTVVAGSLGYWRSVMAKAANYSVAVADSGSSINNNGSVGATTNTLPASWVGGAFRLTVIASQNMAAKTTGSDTIAAVGAITGAGGLIFSSTPRATIDLECQVAGQWLVVGGSTNFWTFQ